VRKRRTPADRVLVPEPGDDGHDLSSAAYFLNRELSWLNFNFRVLHEAEDSRTPLLERLKFVSIVSSNMDEFFMKRIGGLKQQVGAGLHAKTVDGRTPRDQIEDCSVLVRDLEARKNRVLAAILAELEQHGIHVKKYSDLSGSEKEGLRAYYFDNIFPLLTPQATDPAHPFPFISNLSVNLLVMLRHEDDPTLMVARVKVPVGGGIPRFLRVGATSTFVDLIEVMAHNLDLLFPDMVIESCEVFRVTRNANTEKDEDKADDLLVMIESELRDRTFASIVRLEVEKRMDVGHRGLLAAELELDEREDVFEVDGMVAMVDMMELAQLEVPELRDPPHQPMDSVALTPARNIFHVIRDSRGTLLHHPYESFQTSTVRLLYEAAVDPKVRAIKMALYRTSADSRIIDCLIQAARNGKQVAVVVEIKARFDEAANIAWAERLEEAGIHVTYGVVGLKTHCKVTLIIRQDYNGLRRYAHIGTGNYHAGTARIYTDLALLTCDSAIGQDLTELFNYLTTGYKPKRRYQKILPAPKHLKRALIDKIEREAQRHSSSNPGLIRFKLNGLEDEDVVRALYRASQKGAKVDLVVRDTCRIRPGIPGLSENIRVVSVVGRFLEHSRIFHFRNGGEDEYYIGSADCMKRNLESRVEVLVPVEPPDLRDELDAILRAQLEDRRSGWEMGSDGSYEQRTSEREDAGSQMAMIQRAENRYREATRLKKRRPQGIGQKKPRS
jgi:polyphosphate kinase